MKVMRHFRLIIWFYFLNWHLLYMRMLECAKITERCQDISEIPKWTLLTQEIAARARINEVNHTFSPLKQHLKKHPRSIGQHKLCRIQNIGPQNCGVCSNNQDKCRTLHSPRVRCKKKMQIKMKIKRTKKVRKPERTFSDSDYGPRSTWWWLMAPFLALLTRLTLTHGFFLPDKSLVLGLLFTVTVISAMRISWGSLLQWNREIAFIRVYLMGHH